MHKTEEMMNLRHMMHPHSGKQTRVQGQNAALSCNVNRRVVTAKCRKKRNLAEMLDSSLTGMIEFVWFSETWISK